MVGASTLTEPWLPEQFDTGVQTRVDTVAHSSLGLHAKSEKTCIVASQTWPVASHVQVHAVGATSSR